MKKEADTMFNDVQKRLTILYTAMTGLILVVLLSCIFMWNISTVEYSQSAAFQNLWLSVNSHLQLNPILSNSYLAQTEVANRAVIHIEENNVPLFYSGSWMSGTPRTQLVEKAKAQAEAEGISANRAPVSSSMEQSSLFKTEGENGDTYYGRLTLISTEKGFKSLLLLSYITPRTALIAKSLPLFMFLCLVGIAGIFLVSRYLTGRALKPAKEGAQKQVEFIAAASHELRSPLAIIRSGLSALRETDGESLHLLDCIDKECSRMARLVSDMLLLASTDAKNWTLRKNEINIDTLLIESYEAFLPLCRERKLELELKLPETPLPSLMADKQRLEQVLAVLLDNAVSYTPAKEGKTITLTAFEKPIKRGVMPGGSRVIIEVQDQGGGIPDRRKKQLFDRFYRGDASRSDKKHFGLGLSIAKELVELHGGTICVYDNPGGGSRFAVSLPAELP